ncbi:MAG: SprT-like domain-containing protein [Candidatus Brocadiae bacterium]|nr:SprT-like domain-containing protein [Candidatus Brocadiia bacterium]
MNEKTVYNTLQDHQKNETWELQSCFKVFLEWAEIYNSEFDLKIPEISLSVANLKRSCFGHFHPGHNGFGLRKEIAINRIYLKDREFWTVLGTLLHELLHAWQEEYGKPGKANYHNKQFRRKAEGLGLIVDHRGVTEYEKNEEKSPFLQVLKKYGVSVPNLPESTHKKERGFSKMKKWECACPVKIRVAVSHFNAKCMNCGEIFKKVE